MFQIRDANLQFRWSWGGLGTARDIVLHHLHWINATVEDVHRLHQNNGWPGIGYHFLVSLNGFIWQGTPLHLLGTHVANGNSGRIGIAFEGRYDDQTRVMPDAQFNAGVWLIKYVQSLNGNRLRVLGHRDLNPTACPGRFFPMDEMRRLQFRGQVYEGGTDEMNEQQVRELINREVTAILRGDGARVPEGVRAELDEAIKAGIIDGSSLTALMPRWQGGLMALRASRMPQGDCEG